MWYSIIRKREGNPVSAEGRAAEGPEGFPPKKEKNLKKGLDKPGNKCYNKTIKGKEKTK